MNTPTYCGQASIPVPCSDGVVYQNSNPNFYRFNCYAAGTIGFTIVHDEATANYSWQLFDVTNTNPSDIFTNSNLFIACNWSSEPGETGASSDGTSQTVCPGSSQPLFSSMPGLLTGHTYLLMVCNISNSIAGYQLSISGGTAVISDAQEPHLLAADINCDRTQLILRLNKQVKCNTVAADGSDFIINGGENVIGSVPGNCSTPFGTATVTLTLNQPLSLAIFPLQWQMAAMVIHWQIFATGVFQREKLFLLYRQLHNLPQWIVYSVWFVVLPLLNLFLKTLFSAVLLQQMEVILL